MNKFFFTLLLILPFVVNAQIQVQPFFGSDGLQVGTLINKPFSKKENWNYYNYTSYFTEYNNVETSELESYQNVSRSLYKHLGFNVGATFGNGTLIPALGLSYIFENENLNFSIFPSVNYLTVEKEVGFDLNSMFEYTQDLSLSWSLYSLIIFNADYFDSELVSKEYVRLGLEYKNAIQFGVGSDIDNNEGTFNFGGFVGYQF
jgi:hypothetical protein